MKLRTGFVTNSSSYSSAEVVIENPVLIEIIRKYELLGLNQYIMEEEEGSGHAVICESETEITPFCQGPRTLDDILDLLLDCVEWDSVQEPGKREQYDLQLQEARYELYSRRKEIFENYRSVKWESRNNSFGEAEPYPGEAIKWKYSYKQAKNTENVAITYKMEDEADRVDIDSRTPQMHERVRSVSGYDLIHVFRRYAFTQPINDDTDLTGLHFVFSEMADRRREKAVCYLKRHGAQVHAKPCTEAYIEILPEFEAQTERLLAVVKKAEQGEPVQFLPIRNLEMNLYKGNHAEFVNEMDRIKQQYGRQPGDEIEDIRSALRRYRQVSQEETVSPGDQAWIMRHVTEELPQDLGGCVVSYLVAPCDRDVYATCVRGLGGTGKMLCSATDYLLVDPKKCDVRKFREALAKLERGCHFKVVTVDMIWRAVQTFEALIEDWP